MAVPVSSPVPSNANELTEYQTVVSTTGNDQELCIPGMLSFFGKNYLPLYNS